MSREVIHGTKVIGMDIKKYNQAITKIERLERELKDARECNNVKDKYWHNIGVERNTLKEKYAELEEQHATNLVERNSFLLEKQNLEEKVKELETELYFCRRNRQLEYIVDGSKDKKTVIK